MNHIHLHLPLTPITILISFYKEMFTFNKEVFQVFIKCDHTLREMLKSVLKQAMGHAQQTFKPLRETGSLDDRFNSTRLDSIYPFKST